MHVYKYICIYVCVCAFYGRRPEEGVLKRKLHGHMKNEKWEFKNRIAKKRIHSILESFLCRTFPNVWDHGNSSSSAAKQRKFWRYAEKRMPFLSKSLSESSSSSSPSHIKQTIILAVSIFRLVYIHFLHTYIIRIYMTVQKLLLWYSDYFWYVVMLIWSIAWLFTLLAFCEEWSAQRCWRCSHTTPSPSS